MEILWLVVGLCSAATQEGEGSAFKRAAAARFASTHSKMNPPAAGIRRPRPPQPEKYNDTRPLTRDERADLDLIDSVRDGEIPKPPAGRPRVAKVSGEAGATGELVEKAPGTAPGTASGGAAAPAVRPKTRTFELDGGHIPKELSFPGKK